jgi:hypothetical protein
MPRTQIACSKQKKPSCTPPVCEWHVGKGCKARQSREQGGESPLSFKSFDVPKRPKDEAITEIWKLSDVSAIFRSYRDVIQGKSISPDAKEYIAKLLNTLAHLMVRDGAPLYNYILRERMVMLRLLGEDKHAVISVKKLRKRVPLFTDDETAIVFACGLEQVAKNIFWAAGEHYQDRARISLSMLKKVLKENYNLKRWLAMARGKERVEIVSVPKKVWTEAQVDTLCKDVRLSNTAKHTLLSFMDALVARLVHQSSTGRIHQDSQYDRIYRRIHKLEIDQVRYAFKEPSHLKHVITVNQFRNRVKVIDDDNTAASLASAVEKVADLVLHGYPQQPRETSKNPLGPHDLMNIIDSDYGLRNVWRYAYGLPKEEYKEERTESPRWRQPPRWHPPRQSSSGEPAHVGPQYRDSISPSTPVYSARKMPSIVQEKIDEVHKLFEGTDKVSRKKLQLILHPDKFARNSTQHVEAIMREYATAVSKHLNDYASNTQFKWRTIEGIMKAYAPGNSAWG